MLQVFTIGAQAMLPELEVQIWAIENIVLDWSFPWTVCAEPKWANKILCTELAGLYTGTKLASVEKVLIKKEPLDNVLTIKERLDPAALTQENY